VIPKELHGVVVLAPSSVAIAHRDGLPSTRVEPAALAPPEKNRPRGNPHFRQLRPKNTPSVSQQDEGSLLAQLKRKLEGCHHAFFDLGANIGVHTRFIFEPELYPASAYPAIAQSAWGKDYHKKLIQSSGGEK
jgi:hypothetical protein